MKVGELIKILEIYNRDSDIEVVGGEDGWGEWAELRVIFGGNRSDYDIITYIKSFKFNY